MMREQISRLESELERAKNEKTEIRIVPNEVSSELTSLRETKKVMDIRISESEGNMRALRDQIHQLEIELARYRAEKTSAINQHMSLSENIRNQEDSYLRMIDGLQKDILNLKRELDFAQSSDRNNKDYKSEVNRLTERVKELESELRDKAKQVPKEDSRYGDALDEIKDALKHLKSTQASHSSTSVKEVYETKNSDLSSLIEKLVSGKPSQGVDPTELIKQQAELTELRMKLNDRENKIKTAEDKIRDLQNDLNNAKNRKAEYKSRFEVVNREREGSRRDPDMMSRLSTQDDQTKPLMDEISRLKTELGLTKSQLTILREGIVKRKKALLNELSNFVNTKNNFETNLFSELSSTVSTDIDYNIH